MEDDKGHVTITRRTGESIYVDMPCGERITITVSSTNKSRQPRITVIATKAAKITRSK